MTDKPPTPPVHFLNYPAPKGIPVAHPKQSAPLYKIARMMLKGRRTNTPRVRSQTKRSGKKVKFY